MFRYRMTVKHSFAGQKPFHLNRETRLIAYDAMLRRTFNTSALADAAEEAVVGVIEVALSIEVDEEITVARGRVALVQHLRKLMAEAEKPGDPADVTIRAAESHEGFYNMVTEVVPQT